MGTTTRLALPYPAGSDIPNGPSQIEALAAALDAVVGGDFSGTAANRSTVIPSPSEGMRYYATDTKVLSMYDGAAWQNIGPINTAAGNIAAVGAAAVAGSVGLPADAGHVHAQQTAAAIAAAVGNILMPVGFIYHSGGSSPITTAGALATALGFGTWAAYAPAQSLIGVGSYTDGESNAQTITNGQQIGVFEHALVTGELAGHVHTGPSHVHTGVAHTHGQGSHTHGQGPHTHSLIYHADNNTSGGGAGSLVVTSYDAYGPGSWGGGTDNGTGGTTDGGSGGTTDNGTGGGSTGNTGTAGTGNTGSVGSGTGHLTIHPVVGTYMYVRTA